MYRKWKASRSGWPSLFICLRADLLPDGAAIFGETLSFGFCHLAVTVSRYVWGYGAILLRYFFLLKKCPLKL